MGEIANCTKWQIDILKVTRGPGTRFVYLQNYVIFKFFYLNP